jgi:hypothetical protein
MPRYLGPTRPLCEHLARRRIERRFGNVSSPQWNRAHHICLPMFFGLRSWRRHCLFASQREGSP